MHGVYDPGWQCIGKGVGLDDSGNVYVAGETGGWIDSFYIFSDIFLLKINSSGDVQWKIFYDLEEYSIAHDLAVDKSGNSYITGASTPYPIPPPAQDPFIVKINSEGVNVWYETCHYAKYITVDNFGYAYTACTDLYYSPLFGIGKLRDAYPYTMWLQFYGNNGSSANSIVVGDSSNVYVTGEDGGDYRTVKCNTDGVQQWTQIYNGPGNSVDGASSIAVDNLGNVYVTGSSTGIGTGNDYATIKYSQSPPPIPAAPILVSPQNGALLVETNPLLDWDNSLNAESYRVQVSTDSLFTSTVYDSSGIPYSEFQIPNNGLNINTTYYWRVNATNVTGTSPWSAIFHFTTGATNITCYNEIPKEFKLYNNYPNPFNPTTKIKFDIPKSSYVKLIVYDVLGREIKTLVNEKLNAGRYEVSWPGRVYPSGVYFYKMVTDDYVSVKRMVLLK